MKTVLVLVILSFVQPSCTTMETLHFESACLDSSNQLQLQLHCPQYEHIQIVRVIYGYTKYAKKLDQCQFSIYDCIQEGTSQNILSCNGQESCSIHLTKDEILSSTVVTHSVPTCPDFNYVQVNFACMPDSRDVCDRWKDEGATIHLSHTFSKTRQFNRCHCKVRSSIINGQVLLRAREINRQYSSLKSLILPRVEDYDCKKTTYVEIATDRAERKCMDIFPSNGNALFGSGSHNFTITYVKNNALSELFFFFELKASPEKKDHHVQVMCNWARRTTTSASTTPMITTTMPIVETDTLTTTFAVQQEAKLSRLDLIRHRTPPIDVDEFDQEAEDMLSTTTEPIRTSKMRKKKRKKTTIASTISSTTIPASSSIGMPLPDDDEEWSKIISLASIEQPSAGKQLLTINNRTYLNAPQILQTSHERKTASNSSASSSNLVLLILSILVSLTVISLLVYCWTVKRPDCCRQLRMNARMAFIFCCEAGKLLFCSSTQSATISGTTTGTQRTRRSRHRVSSTVPDYQSSEYYMNETGNPCHTSQSIYDGGGANKSIYSIDYEDDETDYDRRDEPVASC